jgi:hypothetical protein
MSVYVGMDVHRKRSQLALLDHDGTQLLNRNLPNDPAELTAFLGRLEPGTPVAFEGAYGWGWLVDLLSELGLEPHLVHPAAARRSLQLGSRTTRSMPARWHTCCALTCCRRPGLPRRPSVTSAPSCATAPPWCGRRPR